eukprot:247982_1
METNLTTVLTSLSDTALNILANVTKEDLSEAIMKECLHRKYTSNLSGEDKQIFHLINKMVNVSSISVLIIEFYQTFKWDETIKPSNCTIDNNGHRMRCDGTTGQWEHVVAKSGARYLEFAIRLDNINRRPNNSGPNICVGIISKPILSNTAGGYYNGNGAVMAHGCQWFSGVNGNGTTFDTIVNARWKKGDVIHITADADTSTIEYKWQGFNKTLTFDEVSSDIYPVACIWYRDTISFV